MAECPALAKLCPTNCPALPTVDSVAHFAMADIPGVANSPLHDLNESLGVAKLKFYGAKQTQLATRYAEEVLNAALEVSKHGIQWSLPAIASSDDVLMALAKIESHVHRATAAATAESSAFSGGAPPSLTLNQHERPLIDEYNQPYAGQATVSRKVVDALANPSHAL